jgi:hypothetical protein
MKMKTPKSWKRRRRNINTNKSRMRTYKEFISILEKFKPFPEDSVSRKINQRTKTDETEDEKLKTHKLKFAKNLLTKMKDNNHIKRFNKIEDGLGRAINRQYDKIPDKNLTQKSVASAKTTANIMGGKNRDDDMKQQRASNKDNSRKKKLLKKIYDNS